MSVAQPQSAGRGLFGNAYLLLAFASLCWSGNHLMGRAIAGHVPPLTIATLRWLFAAAILYPFVREQLAKDWPAIRRHLGVVIYLSLLGGALFGALQFVGLQLTTALNVSVMNSLGPLFIGAAGAVMFRDRLTRGQLAGILISLLGVLAIISKLDPAILSAFAFNLGDMIVLINMVIWGVY
jgi:drug/metabolite transporter (DMT)-like permease